MKYIEYKEQRSHGTKGFPFAYYYLTASHPRYDMIYHWHTEAEIIHIIKGSFGLTCDSEVIMLNEGDCAFINPGVMHGGIPNDCIYECLVFDLTALSRFGGEIKKQLTRITDGSIKIDAKYENGSFFSTITTRIIENMREKRQFYEFFVQSEMLKLLGNLLSDRYYTENVSNTSTATNKLKMLKSALSYIEEHYSEQISLSDIASVCNMNPNYFCGAFRELTGKTPMEYLNYYRIESACEQIASTPLTLIEIALGCGFNDYSYFIKVFKKYKDMTPYKFSKEMI